MSDTDSDSEPPKKKSKSLPVCPYGAKCYRKNPQHFKEFSHPDKDGKVVSKTTPVDKSKLPPCEYGARCYRKNLLHFAEFSHPTTSGASTSTDVPEDSGSDTDVIPSDDEKEDDKKKPEKSKAKDNGLLNRGTSLVKKYSQMTEKERKELIQKAMELKEELQKELKETKKQVEEKDKELNRLQEQVNTGVLLVEGEKEALEGDKIKYFQLLPERQYKEGSANQVHFRLAESQFYRLLSGAYSNQYRVTKVEYVVNPTLVKKFNDARANMKKSRGEEFSHPILAFHGTEEKNIVPICKTGFRVPVSEEDNRTDEGYYGCGVYFSEYPGYSMDYIEDAEILLLAKVLVGKVYHCPGMALGKPLTAGYDSHMSPCKKELVIYHSERILPCYIVHYKNTSAEFKYVKPPEERRQVSKKDELMKLYWKAKKAKKTTKLSGYTIRICGKLCDTAEELGKLVTKHGGVYVAPPAPPAKKKGKKWTTGGLFGFGGGAAGGASYQFFNILITTEAEFKSQKDTAFTSLASNKAQVVNELFLYDSILMEDKPETENYDLEDI